MYWVRFDNKKIRAEVIKEYLQGKKYDGVVCFSCWNATRELKNVGLNVVDISPNGDFIPNKWFKPSEVKQVFPTYFDATSGHLPMEVMQLIGEAFRLELGSLPYEPLYVPTGSGETIVELKLAFPDHEFIAVYNLNNATKYEEEATLNTLVKIIAKKVLFYWKTFNVKD